MYSKIIDLYTTVDKRISNWEKLTKERRDAIMYYILNSFESYKILKKEVKITILSDSSKAFKSKSILQNFKIKTVKDTSDFIDLMFKKNKS